MNKLLLLLLITFLGSCTRVSETEKHQSKRDNIVDVRDKVKEIEIEDVLIGSSAGLYLLDDYLIIGAYRSIDKLVHVFDRKNFSYVTSAVYQGEGPGEITIMGHVGVDEANRKFYVSDHGKQRIVSYDLDSILVNPLYLPKEKMKMSGKLFPDRYQYINDTLSVGLAIEPIGYSDFKQSVAKWNMKTGEIKVMKYEHPEIKKKRIGFAVSMKEGIYVECYHNCDLMTICTLDGELKCNIYGPNWDNQESATQYHYGSAAFCKDKILVSYLGDESFVKDQNKGKKSNQPTKLLIFDKDGNYLQTLETGYRINNFVYDEENNRVIMNLDDAIQFGYLDLNGLVE